MFIMQSFMSFEKSQTPQSSDKYTKQSFEDIEKKATLSKEAILNDAREQASLEDSLRDRKKDVEGFLSEELQITGKENKNLGIPSSGEGVQELQRIDEILGKLNSADEQEMKKGDDLSEIEMIYSKGDVSDPAIDRVMELRKDELFKKFGPYEPDATPPSWFKRAWEKISGKENVKEVRYDYVRSMVKAEIGQTGAHRVSVRQGRAIYRLLKNGLSRERMNIKGEDQAEEPPIHDDPQTPDAPDTPQNTESAGLRRLNPDVISRLMELYGECPQVGSHLATEQGAIDGIFIDCDSVTATFETPGGGTISIPFEDLISSHGETYKKEKEEERKRRIRHIERTQKR